MTDVSSTEQILETLFSGTAKLTKHGDLVTGEATFDSRPVAILGTVNRAYIGADTALAMARFVLDVMRDKPGCTILIVVDNSGHRLGRWDELMGNNGYLAHLTKCLDQARRRGHRVIGLVNELAVSAGFMALGMATDACYALPSAEVRVMALNAMARVTRVPLERLEELSKTSPVLGPGAENYLRVGALKAIWDGDLKEHFRQALTETPDASGARCARGAERGGRTEAQSVAQMVRDGISG